MLAKGLKVKLLDVEIIRYLVGAGQSIEFILSVRFPCPADSGYRIYNFSQSDSDRKVSGTVGGSHPDDEISCR